MRYPLRVADVLVCSYVCDFRYRDRQGVEIVEDSKGVETDVFKIKVKLMLACFGIEVLRT